MFKSTLKKIILWLFLSPVLLLLGGFSYLLLVQEKRIFDFKPLEQNYKFDFDTNHKEVVLNTEDSVLTGLHFKAQNPKGAIYYLHGKGSNLSHSKWKKIVKQFVEVHGYDVFMIDYRGFGKSLGKVSYDGLLRDANAGYNYLKTLFPEESITVYGLSLGTSFATYVASNNQPKQLVLEAPFYSLFDVACTTLPKVPPFMIQTVLKYPLRTDIWIQNLTCPVYIFHGTNDEIIPYDSSIRLSQIAKTPCDLTIIPHGDHNHLNLTQEYKQKIEEILR